VFPGGASASIYSGFFSNKFLGSRQDIDFLSLTSAVPHVHSISTTNYDTELHRKSKLQPNFIRLTRDYTNGHFIDAYNHIN
jgi:hypothetical protein